MAILLSSPSTPGERSYAAAFLRAQQADSVLLVLACAPWCEPCKAMKDDGTIGKLKARGALCELDDAADRELLRKLVPADRLPAMSVYRYDRVQRRWLRRLLRGEEQIRQWIEQTPILP